MKILSLSIVFLTSSARRVLLSFFLLIFGVMKKQIFLFFLFISFQVNAQLRIELDSIYTNNTTIEIYNSSNDNELLLKDTVVNLSNIYFLNDFIDDSNDFFTIQIRVKSPKNDAISFIPYSSHSELTVKLKKLFIRRSKI